MSRQKILTEIKNYCEVEYKKITHWEHDIQHIYRVVENGRKLCEMEKVKPKLAFLVEIACWLHDLGRVEEEKGLEFSASNHAVTSYYLSKPILKPYEKQIGWESTHLILQAVREHNLPTPKHPENRVLRLLIDADRGAGLSVVGIFTMLNYLKIVETEPVQDEDKARKLLPALTKQLVKDDKVALAIEKISYFKGWYYGDENQGGKGVKVAPLFTDAARELYKDGIKEIEEYITRLREISNS